MSPGSHLINPALIDEAAQWLARVKSPEFTASEAEALQRWRSTSADHEYIWNRAKELDQSFSSVPPEVGMKVLDRPRVGYPRRKMLKILGLMMVAPSASWWVYRSPAGQVMRADVQTSVGERRTVLLTDATLMELNTGTAINVSSSNSGSDIQLIEGEVLLDSTPGRVRSPRPCSVITSHGHLRSIGARMIVRCDGKSTVLMVMDGTVTAEPVSMERKVILSAGQQLKITGHGSGGITPLPDGVDGWIWGVLFADRMPLGQFVAELSRYRRGVLRCDPAVAELEVSGTFQLEDPDEVLRLLERSLPIRLKARTRYWVNVTSA